MAWNVVSKSWTRRQIYVERLHVFQIAHHGFRVVQATVRREQLVPIKEHSHALQVARVCHFAAKLLCLQIDSYCSGSEEDPSQETALHDALVTMSGTQRRKWGPG